MNKLLLIMYMIGVLHSLIKVHNLPCTICAADTHTHTHTHTKLV